MANTPPPAEPPLPTGSGSPWRDHFHAPTRSGWITIAIALVAAGLYTWGLGSAGVTNDYYSAAVKAMSTSWKAFFYGSIDSGSFITVDKPPASLWVMALSARIFGFSTWSMLLPQAAAGVASVLIVHRIVREWMGHVAAHLAALAFALTPVAVVMFRYNNPDALLTLLGLGSAWAIWIALKTGHTRCLILSAALVGLAFETKMLQALVVLPAFIGVISFGLPGAMVLYFVTSNLFRVGQQWLITRTLYSDEAMAAGVIEAEAASDSKGAPVASSAVTGRPSVSQMT